MLEGGFCLKVPETLPEIENKCMIAQIIKFLKLNKVHRSHLL